MKYSRGEAKFIYSIGIGAMIILGLVVLLRLPTADAAKSPPCAKAEARMAPSDDSDGDGISNCKERKLLGTNPKDFDSDDDDISDGDEIEDGTDPLNADTDGDGLKDGDEKEIGTDPLDADSDDDGIVDGQDKDPDDDLNNEVSGKLEAITCPNGANGSISVLGLTIALTATTEYDDNDTCDVVAQRFATSGGAHVDVAVTGNASTGLTATDVGVDDKNNNGQPDELEEDDNGGGSGDNGD